MKILRQNVARKEVIDFYLESDNAKKDTTTPSDYDSLDWSNPNTLDKWLCKNGYKHGVLPGYKKWDLVKLSKQDLKDTAIVSGIFKDKPQRLGDLVGTPEFRDWKPDRPSSQAWFEPLSRGEIPESCILVLRPALPFSLEKAKYYVEDGSGRAICYLRAIEEKGTDSELCAYLGTEPDKCSAFMRAHPGLLK
jgi:hypothetical protein